MSDLQVCAVNVLRVVGGIEVDQDFIGSQGTSLRVAMSGRFTVDGDQPRTLQQFYMIGQCAVCNSQSRGDLIQIHLSVFHKKVQNIDPHIGAQGFKKIAAFIRVGDVTHKQPPLRFFWK